MFKKAKPQEPRSLPKAPVVYPSEICVKTEKGSYYYIKGKYRFKISTTRILDSWNFTNILETSEEAIKNYKFIGKLGFRGGTLLKDFASGQFYFISDNLRRHIVSPDVFTMLNLNEQDALIVSKTELDLHEDGDDL